MASILDFQATTEVFDMHTMRLKGMSAYKAAGISDATIKAISLYDSVIDKYKKMMSVLNYCAASLTQFIGRIITKAGNSRSAAPATRTTGNNATKSSSSGSSDPDPYPRRKNSLQHTRLTLARALNATTRLLGGAL